MIEPKDDTQMDDFLDSLLADYSAVQPRLGLEIRIRAGLRAQAARQQRRWMLAFALSAAVVVLAVVIAKVHLPRVAGPRHVAIQKSLPAPVSAEAVPSLRHAKTREVAYGRPAKFRVQSNTPILLQVANAISAEDNLVFEHQKLYLSTSAQQEQEPKADEQPPAPKINIQHLDVRPIEIKDIDSAKEIGSER